MDELTSWYWIGPPTAMVRLGDIKGSLAQTVERAFSVRTTVRGRRVVQRGPKSRRTWPVEIPNAYPSEVANLHALDLGLFGSPAEGDGWTWVDPWMQVTNLLPPAQSMPGELHPGTWSGDALPGGAMTMPGGGRALQTLASDGGEVTLGTRDGWQRTPVVAGVPVTAAVHTAGATGQLVLSWWDAAEQRISGRSSPTIAGGQLARAHVTGIPPEGAVSCLLQVEGVAAIAAPSITWTADLAEWTPGNGVYRVVVDGLSEAVEQAVRDMPDVRRSSMSFSVIEVG